MSIKFGAPQRYWQGAGSCCARMRFCNKETTVDVNTGCFAIGNEKEHQKYLGYLQYLG